MVQLTPQQAFDKISFIIRTYSYPINADSPIEFKETKFNTYVCKGYFPNVIQRRIKTNLTYPLTSDYILSTSAHMIAGVTSE